MSPQHNYHDSKGQGLVEYALILVLVSIAAIVALGFLGNQVGGVFTDISSALNLSGIRITQVDIAADSSQANCQGGRRNLLVSVAAQASEAQDVTTRITFSDGTTHTRDAQIPQSGELKFSGVIQNVPCSGTAVISIGDTSRSVAYNFE